jgi:hypothetical protein
MASVHVVISGLASSSEFLEPISSGRDQIQKVQELAAALRSGARDATSYSVSSSTSDAVQASAEVTATTSGSLGTVIGGTTVTTAFTSTQDGTATQAVADINANTTVNKWVVATKSGSTKFIVTALVPGIFGNGITLTVTGTGASATGSGRLASGTGADTNSMTYSI